MRRVVITGMGIVSPLGCSVRTAWERLHELKNTVCVSPVLEAIEGLHCHLYSPVSGFEIPSHYTRKVLRTMGPLSIMALNSAEQALAQAGLLGDSVLQSGRTGVAYGSSSGSCAEVADLYAVAFEKTLRGMSSASYIKTMPHTAAVNLSVHFGTTGRLITTSTACTSGSQAIGSAYEAIKFGIQDVMIAGGGDEFNAPQVAVFDTLYATSSKNAAPETTPAPFDRNRDGLVVGEGAATLILESYDHAMARGAEIIAEIIGYGGNTDGTHVTQPNAATQKRALEAALRDAAIAPDAVGYINAHGTATKHGDVMETHATHAVFNRAIPISSLKSYIGHTLGACGAIEAILTLQMMHEGWFAPTLNLTDPDPECAPLDYLSGCGREIKTAIAMSNNFAFGGINTSLIFNTL